ncbi:protein MKS1-like [Rutidosis leptorrhynchoides]|uniref:protein MKS1-like n=1 Tax=Rutidosis leptorrhynchoides TaxID=125765 RepID=UPI003A9921E6
MDSTDFPSGKSPRSLQGPRPAPLKVHKDSHKIKKPPTPPHHHQPLQHHHQPPQQQQHRPPVIIYTVSPKIIHTNPNEFMNLVQRLTGPNASSSPIGSSYSAFQDDGGAVSPAVRFASIENAVKSPDGRRQLLHPQQPITVTGDFATDNDGIEMGYLPPGILSPAPGLLPPIPPNFFSPVQNDFFHDLSPVLHSNGRNFYNSIMEANNFMPSPTNLSSHLISPTTPNLDLFHSLFDL